jgi:caffeoyl-CoA O-methyltransferase
MSDGPKSFFLDETLHRYVVAHGTPPDPILRELAAETTKALGGLAGMQIAPEQGAFMTIIARLIGAKRAIEVGTFTGYSALCIARGLPEDGTLICCDVSEEYTSIGQRYWEKAGVADRIDLRIAPAADTLRDLPAKRDFDLAFIDADKTNYGVYYEELLTRIRPGGLILVDNVLWHGAVVDEKQQDDNTVAIRAFNDLVAGDDRVESVMLSISDGLTMLRVRG